MVCAVQIANLEKSIDAKVKRCLENKDMDIELKVCGVTSIHALHLLA